MGKFRVRLLLVLLIVTVILNVYINGLGHVVEAANIVDNGKCGDNVFWALDADGTLTITGAGEMQDYEQDAKILYKKITSAPWGQYEVNKLIIEDGITSIGACAFLGCTGICGELNLPRNLVRIEELAFYGCSGFTGELIIPENVEFVSGNAFEDCQGFDKVVNHSVASVNLVSAGTESQSSYLVNAGEVIPVELKVKAIAADSSQISYQWSHEIWEGNGYLYRDIEGETDEKYIVESVSENEYYRCALTDQFGHEQWVYFSVKIDNELQVVSGTTSDGNGYVRMKVAPGSIPELHVDVTAKDLSHIKYTWYSYKDQEHTYKVASGIGMDTIQDATQPITELTNYYCVIEDQFGNTVKAYFYIWPDNELSLEAVGGHTVKVEYGKDSILQVEVTAHNTNNMKYQWYYCEKSTNGDEIRKALVGETGNTLQIREVKNPSEYICVAADSYGNTAEASFQILIDNKLTVVTDEENMIYVEPDEQARMEVVATALDEKSISYQWYKGVISSSGLLILNEKQVIDKATNSVYISEKVDKKVDYCCDISDIYGSKLQVFFRVTVDNQLSSSSAELKNVCVHAGEKAVLEVVVNVKDDRNLKYTWYTTGNDSLAGANSARYETEEIITNTRYWCNVSDPYGGSRTIIFMVGIENRQNISEKCGQNLTWNIDEDGVLTISGTGEMKNYDTSREMLTTAPWAKYDVKSVVIESGVTSIGDWAFFGCSSLGGKLTIPNTVTSIGEYAFSNCDGITSLVISNSVTRIGAGAFNACSGLTGSLTIPGSVTHIEEYAFWGCEGLTGDLILSEGVTHIGVNAFEKCSNIEHVTIPQSVIALGYMQGDRAGEILTGYSIFDDCVKLTRVTNNSAEYCDLSYTHPGASWVDAKNTSQHVWVIAKGVAIRSDVIENGGVGDINSDGKVDAKDRMYLARYLAGWDGYTLLDQKVADVNGDSKVDAKDRMYLARYLAGWDGYSLK